MIEINAKELLEGLKEIKNTIPRKNDPVAPAGLVTFQTAGKNSLLVKSTDATGQTVYTFKDCLVSDPVNFKINYNLLSKIVKAFKGDLKLAPSTDFVEISEVKTNNKFTVDIYEADKDAYSSNNPSNQFKVSAKDFIRVFSSIINSISLRESRPILQAIHLWSTNNVIKAVATDSHRLATNSFSSNVTKPIDLNLSGLMINKILKDKKQILLNNMINIQVFDQYIKIVTDNKDYYVHLIEGNYPDTTRLINRDSQTTLTTQANALIAKIKAAKIISDNFRSNAVDLNISNDKVTIEAKSGGNLSYVSEISSTHTGEPILISFNPGYMIDALKDLKDNIITLAFNGKLSPITITTASDPSLIELVTPVRHF